MKIANKISISFLVTAIVLTTIALVVLYISLSGMLKEVIFNHLVTATESRAKHIIAYLNANRDAAMQLSQSVVIKKLLATPFEDQAYFLRFNDVMIRLEDTLEARRDVRRIYVANINGTIIVSTVGGDIRRTVKGSPSFLQTKEKAFIGDVHLSIVTGERTLVFSAPVREVDNKTLGVVYMEYTLEELDRVVSDRTGLGVAGEIYLVDRDGHMITPSRYVHGAFLKVGFDDKSKGVWFKETQSESEPPLRYKNYRGIRVAGARKYIPQMQWNLISEIEEKEAWAILAEIKIIFIFFLVGISFVAWVIGICISKVVSGPLRKLRHGAEVVGEGNLDYRTSIRTGDEIGELSRAFDKMTEDLKRTTISRDYINNIIESMNYSLIVVSPDSYKIQTVNQATLNLLGYEREALIGKDLRTVLGDEKEFLFSGEDQKKLIGEGKLKDYELEYKTKEGKPVPVLFSSTILQEKGVNFEKLSGILCIAKDMTEHKKTQQALKESERRLRDVVQGITIPLFVIDKEHYITLWNKACEKLTGFSAGEMVGTKDQWIPFYESPRPCLADLVLDHFSEDVIRTFYRGASFKKTGLIERAYEFEAFFPRLGKKGEWLRFTAAPIKNSKGEIAAVIETLEDITERKQLDYLKDEFVSAVSHELRTPLTTIREVVSQMYDGILGNTTAMQREMLSIALADIDRLTRIINNLLDISKIETEAIGVKREFFDLVKVIKEVAELFYPQAKGKGLELNTRFSKENIWLYIDRDKIVQVFTNLLGNAIKFTQKGFIQVSAIDKGHTVECQVADTGVGIAQEDIPHLFSKFYQVRRGVSPGEKGTGLGLSIAKALVEMHSGKIEVESTLGEGTKFTVGLPKYTARELFIDYVTEGLGSALKEGKMLFAIVFCIKNFTELKESMGRKRVHTFLKGLDRVVKNSLYRQTDIFIREDNLLYVRAFSGEKYDVSVLLERIMRKIKKYVSKKEYRLRKIEIMWGSAGFPDEGATAEALVAAAEKKCRG